MTAPQTRSSCFFQRDSGSLSSEAIMILWFEKQYLQDDKRVKPLLISSVSHPQWKVDHISSIGWVPAGAIHVKEHLVTDS